jgi:hypothetical protein
LRVPTAEATDSKSTQKEPKQSKNEGVEQIIEACQQEASNDEPGKNETEKLKQLPGESIDEPPAKKRKRSVTFSEPPMQRVHFYEQQDLTGITLKRGKVSKRKPKSSKVGRKRSCRNLSLNQKGQK